MQCKAMQYEEMQLHYAPLSFMQCNSLQCSGMQDSEIKYYLATKQGHYGLWISPSIADL